MDDTGLVRAVNCPIQSLVHCLSQVRALAGPPRFTPQTMTTAPPKCALQIYAVKTILFDLGETDPVPIKVWNRGRYARTLFFAKES